MAMKLLSENRRARFDYDILDSVEAGMILTGPEVKSCRNGNVNLSGSYVSILGEKALPLVVLKEYGNSHFQPKKVRGILNIKGKKPKMSS